MALVITLELPEPLAQQAKDIAALKEQRLEDVLVEWIGRAITELPVESLPDEQVLALCDLQMETSEQEVLSDLLARNASGQLMVAEVRQLDELMQVYRRGMVRKARALKVAIDRGLKPALTQV